MTNLELRDKFKYKKFQLSTDIDSVINFKIDQVFRNKAFICNYHVEYKNDKCIMIFSNPDYYGPFLNIEILLLNGETFLLNPDFSKLRTSQRIVMKEIN